VAYQVSYWKMEGASDIELKHVRIKRVKEAYDLAFRARVYGEKPSGTQVITLERTDKQSPNVKELWTASNYLALESRC